MNIIKDALQLAFESIETSISTNPAVDGIPITPAAEVHAKMIKAEHLNHRHGTHLKIEPTLLMNGPLSTLFTRALRIAYARVEPTTSALIPTRSDAAPGATPNANASAQAATADALAAGEAGSVGADASSFASADYSSFGDGSAMEGVALETQSNDYINAAMAQRERSSAFPQSGVPQGSDEKTVGSELEDVNTTISGLKPVPITKDEAIAIFKPPIDELGSGMPDFADIVFYVDATAPTPYSPMGEKEGEISMLNVGKNSKNWRVGIESISIHVKTKTLPEE